MTEENDPMEDELRRVFADEPVPPSLWPRIQASLKDAGNIEPSPGPARTRWWSPRAIVPIAAMLLLVVVGVGLLTRAAMTPGITQSDLATVLIDEFRTFKASGRAFDIVSSQPAEVRRWFLAKVDLPLPAPVARVSVPEAKEDHIPVPEAQLIPVPEAQLARLTGGRLCYLLDRRVASFMYADDGQSLSLYVMSTADLPVATLSQARVMRHRDYTAVLWSRGDLAYVLVSKLTGDRAVELLRRMAPATET